MSLTLVKMILTLIPLGLGIVIDPLNGKISFLTKVEGTLCERMRLSKEVGSDGLVKLMSGIGGAEMELLGLGKGESGM